MAGISTKKADDYRAQAREATILAERSGLANVRRKHEMAAAVWLELAQEEERRAAVSRERLEKGALRKAPSPDGHEESEVGAEVSRIYPTGPSR